MRKGKFSKAVVTVLVLSLMSGLFASCGADKDPASGTGTTTQVAPVVSENKVPLYTERKDTKGMSVEDILKGDLIYSVDNIKFPISEKPITLTFMRRALQDDVELSKMALLVDYAKKTNVNIKWNSPQDADFETKYNLLMASGEYPDAVFQAPAADIEKYGQQGLFIEMNDLIDNNMPNLKAILETNKNIKKIITSDDGKVYSLPSFNSFVTGNNVMMVREDWLKKLNLAMPVTTDDWYNVLKAFKAMDPTVFPMSAYTDGSGGYSLRGLISAWGVFPEAFYAADGLVQPKDGKMHFGPTESLYKDGLTWIKKLYDEKLIDPEFVTDDMKAFQAKVMQDKVGAWRGWINGDMYALNETAKKNGKADLHIVEAPIMKGPNGDQVHMWRNSDGGPAMVITKANKYAKETAIWADYWYSDWGRTYVYGVENVTYTIGEDKQPHWTDYVTKNPEGKTTNQVRGSVTFGRGMWPCVFQPWSLTASTVPQEIEDGRIKYRKAELMTNPLPQGLSFSNADNDLISQKMTDITTYVNEMFVKFIVGKEPLTNWDAYVKKIDDMGMQQLLEIYNKSYDSWKKR